MRSLWRLFRETPQAFIYALLVHLVLVAFLAVSLDWTPKPQLQAADKPVIEAVALDEAQVRAEMEKLQAVEEREQQAAEARLREAEEKRRQAEAARQAEQQRLEKLKQEQAAEAERQAELKRQQEALVRKREQEQKRLAEIEAKRQAEEEARRKAEAEAKRKAEEEARRKAEAEAKRQAEEEARRKAEAEAKRKAEEEARRKAEEEARRKAEQALQQQLEAERQALAAAEAERVVSRYVAAIQQKVERNWIQPPGSRQGLTCTVRVGLIPGGEVTRVSIVKGSGDAAFDRSVEAAVWRSSPLPLPPDNQYFDRFRDLTFRFSPE
ncbi:cell envelope integrity protein TolA [Thiohalobacter thiocyanaticus]|uniref:cell envelope integrity protein TolA n=1 Tax=Thiohalobacter thiocyanaticus TaxID=585455 RepID=UPI001F4E9099|nr:cell envelope integrity protein TolA [Thiohalobacter thiocyanaticus]